MSNYNGVDRRKMMRREEDHCGSHAVCVAEFTNAVNNLARKVNIICEWKTDHEQDKDGKMDQIRTRFRTVEDSVHAVETSMIKKTQAVKDWLNTRVIIMLGGLVINMLLIIVTFLLNRTAVIALLVVGTAFYAVPAYSQQAPNVQVQLSQPLGPEEDIGTAVLYVTNDCDDPAGYGEASRIERITPLDPAQANPLVFTYQFYAPDQAETQKCFVTTFIDTSGNESQPGNRVTFRVDKLPPGAPVGLTAEEVQLSQ